MIVERDAWLSEQLGRDSFRVVIEPRLAADGGADPDLHFLASCLPARAAKVQPALYYAKVPSQQIATVATLSAFGFQVVDVSVQLSCMPQVIANPGCHPGFVVREATLADSEQLLHIASSCFRYSRFHLDPMIAPERANAIKRAWVQSYLDRRRGERLLVALADDRPVGFLAILGTRVHGKTSDVIDLIGVDQTQQQHGVGRALVGAFLVECTKRGTLALVGTQVANIPSLRLYESLGFRICETTYVLHAHVGGGGLGE